MAEIVLGMATSHGPQINIPPQQWNLLSEKDIADPRMDYPGLLAKADPRIATQENTPAKWQERYDACHAAIAVLKERLDEAKPDAIVLVGDDQHEQFLENNLPMFSIFYGPSFTIQKRIRESAPEWIKAEAARWSKPPFDAPGEPGLARHLIDSLRENDFDIASSNELKPEIGLGHAFTFLYRYIHPDATIPMVPFMVNTFFPPSQPTPRRCYAIGAALRAGIESWNGADKVAVIASGGMSHTVIDEDLDHLVLDAVAEKDKDALSSLPMDRMAHGTSEILNWVVMAGAMEPYNPTIIDYIPCYRTPAGTGHADAFAYWR